MWRGLAVFLVLTVALPIGCSSKKTEASGGFVSYLPTTLGDKWVMLELHPLKVEQTHEVTAVEIKDGALFVKTESRGKEVLKKICDTGEYVLQEGATRYDPPVRVLPASIKEGDQWRWEKPRIVKWTFTAGKEEEVEVPAGKFKAIRIEGEGQSEGKPVKCIQWIARGHPTIKTIIRFDDGRETVEVLKSFTPGTK